jgi:hypothetical protein
MPSLRAVIILAMAGSAAALWAPAARADHRPAIVVPTRPDVPVIINGIDVRGSIVYGDWGLYRAGHMGVFIVGPAVAPLLPPARDYYPSTGRPPRYGRQEIRPSANRVLPPPAQPYERSWSTRSDPLPPTQYTPYEGPPVIVAPPVIRR